MGTTLKIRNCKPPRNEGARFVVQSYGNAGYQFEVINTGLCLQKMGSRRAIKLKPCREKSSQLFADFKLNERFELGPVDVYDGTERCVSQHHHPRQDEQIYAEKCGKAHRRDTGYWVAY